MLIIERSTSLVSHLVFSKSVYLENEAIKWNLEILKKFGAVYSRTPLEPWMLSLVCLCSERVLEHASKELQRTSSETIYLMISINQDLCASLSFSSLASIFAAAVLAIQAGDNTIVDWSCKTIQIIQSFICKSLSYAATDLSLLEKFTQKSFGGDMIIDPRIIDQYLNYVACGRPTTLLQRNAISASSLYWLHIDMVKVKVKTTEISSNDPEKQPYVGLRLICSMQSYASH